MPLLVLVADKMLLVVKQFIAHLLLQVVDLVVMVA
jgi:hypothetical protein